MSIRLGYKNLFDLLIDQITKQEKYKPLLCEPDKVVGIILRSLTLQNKGGYTPLQLAIKHIRSDFMGTLLSMKEVVKGAEKDKLVSCLYA